MTSLAAVDRRVAGVATGARDGCAALSESSGEPIAGTAPAARRVVAVEHIGSWPRAISAHPDAAVSGLFERLRGDDTTLLLIRRPGRRIGRDCNRLRTVIVADLAPGGSRVATRIVRGTDDLDEIVCDPGARVPVTDPIVLVCAHGRRDACCAIRGRALAADLAAEGSDVWECSHLGGHRFAPTALVLPTGYAYGRLDTGGALAALEAAARGNVEPWSCRGHVGLEPAQQVAELAVREHTGIGDAGALVVDAVDGPDTVTVRSRDGRVWAVDVRVDSGPAPRPPSCGAALEPPMPLVAGTPVELTGR